MLSRPHLTDRQDTRIAEYRAVSSSAVAGLILGLLSPAAAIDPVLWAVPIAGIIFSSLSLRRIAQNAPALIGRKAAIVGLILSIFFGSAAVTDWCAYRAMLRRQSAVPIHYPLSTIHAGQARPLHVHPLPTTSPTACRLS